MIKFKNKTLILMIGLILITILSLFFIGAHTSAAQGPDPKATISLEKTKVGSGTSKPNGVFITPENGFNPGVSDEVNGTYLASGDDVSYTIKLEVTPGNPRRVAYKLNIPEYLTYNKNKNLNVCTSNMFLSGTFDQNTLICTYEVKKGVAASMETKIVLTAKDTQGAIEKNQVLSADIGVGIDANNPVFIPYATSRAQAVSVISAPMADLMIKPSQCNINRSCGSTLYSSLSGSFQLIVNPLKYPGYNNTYGATAMTPYTAQIDVSNFPEGTIWKLGSVELAVVNGVISIPEASGNQTITFTVPDNKWGGDEFDEGETRSYDVNLIVPESAFASSDYLNNGNGWQPGQGENSSYYTSKESNVGVQKGWYYNNNNWTKYVVYRPVPPAPPAPPTSTISVSKSLQRPWNNTQTLWEDANQLFSAGQSVNAKSNSCSNQMCTDMVTPGTEFNATFTLNVLSTERTNLPMTLSDTWNPNQVELVSLIDLSGKLNVAKIEWLVGDTWQTSSSAIQGASAFKVSYDGTNYEGNNTVKLGFKVKKDLNVNWGVTTISDTATATFINNSNEEKSSSAGQTFRTPTIPVKKLSLGVNVSPTVLPYENRKASWTYTPTVSGMQSSKEAVDGTFTITLDPSILSFNLTTSDYEVVSINLGNFKAGKDGTVVVKPKGGSYLGKLVGGVMSMPAITFDTNISLLAEGNDIKTSMLFSAFEAQNVPDASNTISVSAEKPIETAAMLSALTPKVERNEQLKYQYIMMLDANMISKPQTESVIILPTMKDNSAYLNEYLSEDDDYNNGTNPIASNFQGTYSASASINEANSSDDSTLMCTTNPTPSMNPEENTWSQTCDASQITAYKVVLKAGSEHGLVMVDLQLNPTNNIEGDNYLMWPSYIYTDGDKTSIAGPANEQVIASTITGYVYWDILEAGSAYNASQDGIENIQVQLLDKAGNPVLDAKGNAYITTTDENGQYEFTGLISGNYQVKVLNQPTSKESAYYPDKTISVKPSYVYNNMRGDKAVAQNGISTTFTIGREANFKTVGFGYFGPDPYTNVMKKPANVQCQGDELQCNIQWEILIKSGNQQAIPGKIKLMYVLESQVTLVVTEKNKVYIWGNSLDGLNIKNNSGDVITSSNTPVLVDTSAIGDEENIEQITGSYINNISIKNQFIILTSSGSQQKLYGLGNGTANSGYGGNKFGTGSGNYNYTDFTDITLPYVQQLIQNNGGIKSLVSNCHNTFLLMNNGRIYTSGYANDVNGQQNSTGGIRVEWTEAKIMDGTEDITAKTVITKISTFGFRSSSTAIDDQGRLFTMGAAGLNGFPSGVKTYFTLNTEVGGTTKIKDIRNYWTSNMAISEEGNIYVWGSNQYGMLGNGTASGNQVAIKKIIVDFKASEFLTSNNFSRNSCNIIKSIDDKIYGTGQCKLPGQTGSINSTTFQEINFNAQDYQDTVLQTTSAMAINNEGLLNVYGATNVDYIPSNSLSGNAASANGAIVNGPWVSIYNEENNPEGEGQIYGTAGSVDINDIVLTDNTSSQVYDVSASLSSMSTAQLFPNETDLGNLSPNSVNENSSNSSFTTRTYGLPMLENGTMFKVLFSGSVNKTSENQVIGNQAWITSAELPRLTPAINSLPAYDGSYGKWDGNAGSACAPNTDWGMSEGIDVTKQNNCDQVYATIPKTEIPLGSLGGIVFWDKNKDGIYNDEDELLANVRVYLMQGEDVVGSMFTDNNGEYLFNDLLPATDYSVSFSLPSMSTTNKNESWQFTQQKNTTCDVENQSCVNTSGETANLEVVANTKSVGDNTVNAGVINIIADLNVSKGIIDENNEINSNLNKAEYKQDYTISVKIENNGEEALSSFYFEDTTTSGQQVTWNSCSIDGVEVSTISGAESQDNVYLIALDSSVVLEVNKTMICTGTLTGLLSSDDNHSDSVSINASGVDSGLSLASTADFAATLDEDTIPSASISLEKGIIIDNEFKTGSEKVEINQAYQIEFKIKNTSEQKLINLNLNDNTISGPSITDVSCDFRFENIDENIVSVLDENEEATCLGTLMINDPKDIHENSATVSGEGVVTGEAAASNEASLKADPTIEIEPVAPTLDKKVECEQDYKINVPKDSDGIKYQLTKKDKKVVVKAIAEDGYVFKTGVKTEWKFDVSNTEKCPVDTTNPLNPLPSTGSNDIIYALLGLTISIMSGCIFIRKRQIN